MPFLPFSVYPRVLYWLKGEPRQNFGDFLTELFIKQLFTNLKPRIPAGGYRLIGSVIHSTNYRNDMKRIRARKNEKMVYWGCGMRENAPLDDAARQNGEFLGVRGPLTRDLLGLPADTVLGDPGFLVPLLHQPRPSKTTQGKTICVPHILDPKTEAQLLALSGADCVVWPGVKNSLRDLTRLLDDLASARFMLTGSLHGAVMACVYGVPFAFWDSGHIDFPFKWTDMAASLSIPAVFAKNVKEGEEIYRDVLQKKLRLPALLPILNQAPFPVRDEIMQRAAEADSGVRPLAAGRARLIRRRCNR